MKPTVLVLTAALLTLATAAIGAQTTASPGECSALAAERAALKLEVPRLKSAVEAKNAELGETSDARALAKAETRRRELARRAEGLQRELTVLLDREHETVDRLGFVESTIAKRCGKGGGK